MQQDKDLESIAIRKAKKKRLIRSVIIVCLVLLPLLTILEKKVYQLGVVKFPVSGNVLVFVLININVILLLLMVFLVLRNLAELVFEHKRRILGTRLRTKLVASFISLSLIPTGLLFFIALQFVSTSMDYWFNINVDQSLEESLQLAQNVYQESQAEVNQTAQRLAEELAAARVLGKEKGRDAVLAGLMNDTGLAGLEVVTAERVVLFQKFIPEIEKQELPAMPGEQIRRVFEGERFARISQAVTSGELLRSLAPVVRPKSREIEAVLIASSLIPRQRMESMHLISKGIEGYRQLLLLKKPIKTSLLFMLLLVTLLIVFCAVWFGLYVAGGLTRPMESLTQGLQRVADGDLHVRLEHASDDEMGDLVDSFNVMTMDLRSSREQIEQANEALRAVNVEIDQRRRYTEIILQNITAGVISIDERGRITTINKFAEQLLKIDREMILNKHYRTILRASHLEMLEHFFDELNQSGKPTLQRPLRITVNDETLSLRVNFTKLVDEENRQIGVVIVFDNLTEIEKMERMAAWREVARRIAHEVKNPLTPIQLSAQRLKKKYAQRLGGDETQVFERCTNTIINQVDELKRLVSEFSNFARMPAVKKSLNNLDDTLSEVLTLYREAHPEIDFQYRNDGVPVFAFDKEQLRRVFVNLFDNAVAVVSEQNGLVETIVHADQDERKVFIEIIDNGPGIRDEDKLRMFEPYFSTKKTGTGLGLAIASTVVADHGGYIRVKDHEPHGAYFVIELPLEQSKLEPLSQ